MSVRTPVLIALVIIGVASTATVSSNDVLAGTTRVHHRHHTVHRSVQVRYPHDGGFAGSPVGSPYCWPYDYAFNPYEYCGASYIISW